MFFKALSPERQCCQILELKTNPRWKNKLPVGFISWQGPLKDLSIMVTLQRKHEIDSWMKNFLSAQIFNIQRFDYSIWPAVIHRGRFYQKRKHQRKHKSYDAHVGAQKMWPKTSLSDTTADSGNSRWWWRWQWWWWYSVMMMTTMKVMSMMMTMIRIVLEVAICPGTTIASCLFPSKSELKIAIWPKTPSTCPDKTLKYTMYNKYKAQSTTNTKILKSELKNAQHLSWQNSQANNIRQEAIHRQCHSRQ